MPAFSPQETAKLMISRLRNAYTRSYWLASQQVIPVDDIVSAMDDISRSMTQAHTALQTLQGAFSNAVIASRVAEHLEPSPADLAAAYTGARQAWIAMCDDYSIDVIPALPFPKIWDNVNRTHNQATFNVDTPTNFKSNVIALRDALEAFS